MKPGRRSGKKRGFLRWSLLLAAFLAGSQAFPALAQSTTPTQVAARPNPWTMCAKATNRVERREGLPRQLLRAISKIESGRFHRGKQIVMAWPWTVMAEGRGRYLPSKAAAIAEVEALWARGVRNIDVGCMQVNLHYHPHAFASLEEAFDPMTNVAYAAEFLRSLAYEHGSWAKAVAHYHSANPKRYRTYRVKVHHTWRREREKYLIALTKARREAQQALAPADETGAKHGGATHGADAPAGDPMPLVLATLSFATASVADSSTHPADDAATDSQPARATDDPLGTLAFGRAGPVAAETRAVALGPR